MEWRASHILVKEKGLADDLRNRIKSGGNFGALAGEFSTCPSKSKSGDLGGFGPGKMVKGMGGAMDLVASAENIIVAMMHTNRAGASKLLKKCSLPLTGVNCVKKVVTNLAVMVIEDNCFKLLERAPGVSVEEIKEATEGDLIVEGTVPEMQF